MDLLCHGDAHGQGGDIHNSVHMKYELEDRVLMKGDWLSMSASF